MLPINGELIGKCSPMALPPGRKETRPFLTWQQLLWPGLTGCVMASQTCFSCLCPIWVAGNLKQASKTGLYDAVGGKQCNRQALIERRTQITQKGIYFFCFFVHITLMCCYLEPMIQNLCTQFKLSQHLMATSLNSDACYNLKYLNPP